MLFHSEENILAVWIADLAFINVYFPCDRKSVQSLNKFAKTCSVLKKVADSASSFGYQFVVAGDFNADLLNSNLRSDMVFQSLSEFKLLDKNRSFSYIHHSESHTIIDHVLCSPKFIGFNCFCSRNRKWYRPPTNFLFVWYLSVTRYFTRES